MKQALFNFVLALILLTLAACQLLITDVAGETGMISLPPARSTATRPISVADVQIQVGAGSPIPVNVLVSGEWPDQCAQLSAVQQHSDGFQIEITLVTTPAEPDCPPDPVGVPFGMAIPLNSVGLAQGEYTVTVNGVKSRFAWPSPSNSP